MSLNAFAGRAAEVVSQIHCVRQSAQIFRDPANGCIFVNLDPNIDQADFELIATLPPLYPEWLGDRHFNQVHNVKFAYIAGEMANRIATEQMVIAMGKAGMLGFFGAGGLRPAQIDEAITTIETALSANESWGSNLIHSPQEPTLEEATIDLYLKRRVRRVSASAFMTLAPSIVRYACTGLRTDAEGHIHRSNFVFAKLSRPEVARHFMSPPPAEMLRMLVAQGGLTQHEADLAAHIPVAEDITVEADSGGHTDNRPLNALLPAILMLRDELSEKYSYLRPIRVGAAGGICTPSSVASAFAMGASYVMTGSVNQSAVESGLSESGRKLLAQAGLADVAMAPAGDMFELGVKLQVLKRGTLFAQRAARLYELYSSCASIDAIPASEVSKLEKDIFQQPLSAVWDETKRYFSTREPRQIERAESDPKHKMALLFRWYLGQSSRWAITGDPKRRMDYQIWCGPAMGAFNAWVAGSFLEDVSERTVVQIALNLLEGAAVVTRAHQFRTYGVDVPAAAFNFRPRPLSLGERGEN